MKFILSGGYKYFMGRLAGNGRLPTSVTTCLSVFCCSTSVPFPFIRFGQGRRKAFATRVTANSGNFSGHINRSGNTRNFTEKEGWFFNGAGFK